MFNCLWLINKSNLFDPQVNNISKMTGPTGPPGFNGSRGATGAPGPKGDFSACQYKMVTETLLPGDSLVTVGLAEPSVSMLFRSLSPLALR